jgi:transposase-like protein
MEKLIKEVFKRGKPLSKRSGTEPYDARFKTKVIGAYLRGEQSFAMLGRKYKMNPGVISRWVRIVRHGRKKVQTSEKVNKFTGMSKKIEKTQAELLQENKELKKRLEEAELKALVWQKVVEVADRELKLDIAKKYAAMLPRK